VLPTIRGGARARGRSGLTASLSGPSDVVARVAVGSRLSSASFSGLAEWTIEHAGGGGTARVPANQTWTIARAGSQLRIQPGSGTQHTPRGGTVVLRPATPADAILYAGKRYRGELHVTPTDSGLLIMNRIGVEDYLRGVVPLEIGNRPAAELAAAQAQAIAARSYVYVRIRARQTAQYDILSDVREQVYGGVEAEQASTDEAVATTAGLVLVYNGRLVDAPYHSTCGGSTAAPSEVWRSRADLPYLRPVSDRIPGTDRFWCDGSATFRWTRTMGQRELTATIARYLRNYAAGAPADPGTVRDLVEGDRTPSGRLGSLTVVTQRGRYALRGNDMRFVLRTPGGQILNSTDVRVSTTRSGGTLQQAVFRGAGNGHGIGMCQWGAIGRARAGHSAQEILAAYYVGTSVVRVNETDLRSPR
jgi:stage II sporulation protein D